MMKLLQCLLVLSLLTAGCSKPPAPAPTPAPSSSHGGHAGHGDHVNHSEHAGHDHSQHESMDQGEPSDESIYNLEGQWENQHAKPVSFSHNKGKVVLVAMVYASCKAACPMIIQDIKAIEKEAVEKYPGKMRYTLITIDPEVDTPEKLLALSTESGLDSTWELLRGDADQVREMAALLGVKYRKVSETDYAHSNMITVLNEKGEVVHQQIGLGVKPGPTLEALEKLLTH